MSVVLSVQERATVWSMAAAALPAPLRACEATEPGVSVTNDKLAVAVPALCGENFTVKGTLCPAVTVTGKVSPLTVNSGLVVLTSEITIGLPVALSDAALLELAPTVTFPKLRLVGTADTDPVPV